MDEWGCALRGSSKQRYKKGFESCKYIYWRKNRRKSSKLIWACGKTRFNEPVWKLESWSSGDVRRERGRPKMTWRVGAKINMMDVDLQIEIVEKQNKWWRVHVDDHLNILYIAQATNPKFFRLKLLINLLLLLLL